MFYCYCFCFYGKLQRERRGIQSKGLGVFPISINFLSTNLIAMAGSIVIRCFDNMWSFSIRLS